MGVSWSADPESTEESSQSSVEDTRITPSDERMNAYRPSNQFAPKKLKNPVVTILKEILRTEIKLDERLVRENNEILREFLDTFINEMKRVDEVFSLLHQEIYYTGSYYSDLRISKPDEYDLNIVLKLPFKLSEMDVIFQPQAPSYVKYKLKSLESIAPNHVRLVNSLFKDGYLMPEKVRLWLQSVVDRALLNYSLPKNCVNVRRKAAGPARTIILIKRNGVIDIDLVPTIRCSIQEKVPGIDGRVYDKVKNNLKCFLVPKPYQNAGQAPINKLESSRLWRTHFPDAESMMIYNLGCVKPVIKLLKLLRNKEKWKILASYYLKTVLMWMILENPSQEYWKEDKMGDRFIEALEKLAEYVKQKKIPYFFSSKHNLISKMAEDQKFNIYHRLCAIIKDIKRNPYSLWKIFNAQPTFVMATTSKL